MSRQPQLPPRCPTQKKSSSPDPSFSAQCKDVHFFPHHKKSISQSSILEERPAWFDELLSDSDSSTNLKVLRRASSDPQSLLDNLAELPVLGNLKSDQSSNSTNSRGGLESACVYGPNSPRSKESLRIPENFGSALSKYSFQTPLQYADDELFSGLDSSVKGKFLRRASSDPVTLQDGLAQLPVLENFKGDKSSDFTDASGGLESAGLYGPNSPRSKGKLSIPDNIVSALSSYTSQSPLKYADKNDNHFTSGVPRYDAVQDASGSTTEVNLDVKPGKRNCGQRSRVRKIQYIAELERTVHIYQNLETELAVRVASLLHQHASLSLENKELKHRLARLQQEKLIVDGQHQSLRKEVERLKLSLAYAPDSKMGKYYRLNSTSEAVVSSEATWQMPDMRKLDIN